MDKKRLEKFYKNKTKIKLNLKNGRYYTGIIIRLDSSSLVFRDKFNNELPFDLESISYVDVIMENKNG